MEEMHLRKAKIDCDVTSYWEYPSPENSNWYDVLQNSIKGFKRVGTETHIKSDILNKIYANEVIQVDLVDEMRKVKSPFELELIKNTSKTCDKAIEKGKIIQSTLKL